MIDKDRYKNMKVSVGADGLVLIENQPEPLFPDMIEDVVYCGNYLCPSFTLCRSEKDTVLDGQEIGRGYCRGFYVNQCDKSGMCEFMCDVGEDARLFLEETDRQLGF